MRELLAKIMKGIHAPIYRSRIHELVSRITPHLRPSDRVLDVGCGNGTLGQALLDASDAPSGLAVEGLERSVRLLEPIVVHAYNGRRIPFEDSSFDVVILADVLHHEENPDILLRECTRISRRLVIIKDHQVKGPFAQSRIELLDWAANAPHGVPCLFKYNTPEQWNEVPRSLQMKTEEVVPAMRLYPFPWWLVFGGGIQFFTVMRKQT